MQLVLAVLAAEVAVFVVSVLPGVRGEEGFVVPLDGWLQGATYVTIAVLAALRPILVGADRRLWTWVAAALALRAAGFVVFLAYVREQQPPPYPSLADACWIAMTVALGVGLVQYAGAHVRRMTTTVALDAIVGALASAALALALLWGTLQALTAPGVPSDALGTNLAYPIADVALVLIVVATLAAFAWHPPAGTWLLAFAVVGWVVNDSVFLYQATAGTFRPGSLLAALSIVTTALIALAAWWPEPDVVDARPRWLPGLVLPATFALTCLGVLVAASVFDVPFAAVLLATAGLVVALVRTILTFRDVRAMAEVRREARTDELTGVANRRAFNERLERALRRRDPDRPLALLIVDLDDFKDVNDTLGHHHGDELLSLVAPRLEIALRAEDLLARIGGDEFAVLLDGANADLAAMVAERLGAGIRRPFPVAGRDLPVEASIGIAVFPDHATDPTDLLRCADLAMYDAKASNDRYRFFRAEHHRGTRERLETIDRLRLALVNDELELHYQPQVDLRTGEVTGVEALVRWRHPDAGLLGPAKFLPQAESGGLMPELSLSVLDMALGQLARWRSAGHDITMAVNLSVTNLLDLDVPGQVSVLLAAHGVPGNRLVLELTEDLFMADPARGERVIRRLLDADVRIVVDDYGTGYSSLGYLRDLRDIAGLKLDRSFVTTLDSDPRARAIVASTIGLAQALGLELVAEGVETEHVRDELAALGCEQAQGYLFCRPCPAGELSLGRIDAAQAAPGRR